MPIPPDAEIIEEPMDPSDVKEYGLRITGPGDEPFPMLTAGQSVTSYKVGPSIEALGLGISIMSGNGYDPTLTDGLVTFYPVVSQLNQNLAAFLGVGQTIGIEVTIVKNTTPPETLQRTGGIVVRQA